MSKTPNFAIVMVLVLFFVAVFFIACTGPKTDTMCVPNDDGSVECLKDVKIKGIKLQDM